MRKPRFKTLRGVPYEVCATVDPGVMAIVVDPETSPIAYLLKTKGHFWPKELGSREVDVATVERMYRIPKGAKTHDAWLWMTTEFDQ